MATRIKWIREECQKIVEEDKILDVIRSIAKDKKARHIDRLKATEMLMDRAYGRPQQGIEVGGPEGTEFSAIPTRSIETLVELLSRRTPAKASNDPQTEEGS